MTIFKKIEIERGLVARIYSDFSEFPTSVEAHYSLNKALMLQDGPLPREEREWIAVCVSRSNNNLYCQTHHNEAYFKYKGNMTSEQANLINEMASSLTLDPARFERDKIKNKFLACDYTEAQWQHAINIIGYFNFTNRLAFGMGIELEVDYEKSCS